jgi:hypothetical protein
MSTFNLANRIKIVNANPNIDSDYGPYNSLAEANTEIPVVLRRVGKTVGILVSGSVVEYWWKSNTTDLGLIPKGADVFVDNIPTNGSTNAVSSDGVFDALATKENTSNKGVAGGYASLDGTGKVPSSQLPSYVDQIIEVANFAALPVTGASNTIYITLNNNQLYRWGGTVYVLVSSANSAVWGAITGTLSNQTDLQLVLDAKQNILFPLANGGISISGNNISTIYNTAIADNVSSIAVGGAAAALASSWKTKSLVEALDTILFPTIPAYISSFQSAGLSLTGASGTYEIGTPITATLTASFNRGQIVNGNGVNGPNLVGTVTSTPYLFTGTGIGTPPAQSGNTFAISQTIVGGSNVWNVQVSYNAGTGTYTDNKGVSGTNLNASRVAGNTSASSAVISGQYRQFFGGATNPVTTSADVRALAGNNFANNNSFQIYIGTTRFVLAIPVTKSIVSIITSNFENITLNFTQADFNVLDAGSNPIPYKIFTFVSGTPLNLNATVTLS